ncbi:MAG: PIN domain-containing protein [Pirellulaceae bacterium]
MNVAFLDTSFLLAIAIANDQFHEPAQAHWVESEQSANHHKFVTTSYILNEVVTYLNSRSLHAKAVEIGTLLLAAEIVRLVHVEEPLFLEGWRFFERHRDKTYSLTDCISFVLMKQLGIQTAFTFDHHFQQAGFLKEP